MLGCHHRQHGLTPVSEFMMQAGERDYSNRCSYNSLVLGHGLIDAGWQLTFWPRPASRYTVHSQNAIPYLGPAYHRSQVGELNQQAYRMRNQGAAVATRNATSTLTAWTPRRYMSISGMQARRFVLES